MRKIFRSDWNTHWWSKHILGIRELGKWLWNVKDQAYVRSYLPSRPFPSSPLISCCYCPVDSLLLCRLHVLSALASGCAVGCAFYAGISSSTGISTSISTLTLLCTFPTLSELSALSTSAFISPTISAILFLSRWPGNRIVGLKNRVGGLQLVTPDINWAAGDENYGVGQSHRLQNSWFHLAHLQYCGITSCSLVFR